MPLQHKQVSLPKQSLAVALYRRSFAGKSGEVEKIVRHQQEAWIAEHRSYLKDILYTPSHRIQDPKSYFMHVERWALSSIRQKPILSQVIQSYLIAQADADLSQINSNVFALLCKSLFSEDVDEVFSKVLVPLATVPELEGPKFPLIEQTLLNISTNNVHAWAASICCYVNTLGNIFNTVSNEEKPQIRALQNRITGNLAGLLTSLATALQLPENSNTPLYTRIQNFIFNTINPCLIRHGLNCKTHQLPTRVELGYKMLGSQNMILDDSFIKIEDLHDLSVDSDYIRTFLAEAAVSMNMN